MHYYVSHLYLTYILIYYYLFNPTLRKNYSATLVMRVFNTHKSCPSFVIVIIVLRALRSHLIQIESTIWKVLHRSVMYPSNLKYGSINIIMMIYSNLKDFVRSTFILITVLDTFYLPELFHPVRNYEYDSYLPK